MSILRLPSGRRGVWVLCATLALASPHRDAATAAAARRPESCKASPPVRVELAPGATPDVWRLRLEALTAEADVALSLGADAGTPRLVWRGALTAGETRSFDVRFTLPATAGTIRAQADVVRAAPTVLRSVAAIPLSGGKPMAAAAIAATGAGRLVTNPQNGQVVLELPGEIGGQR